MLRGLAASAFILGITISCPPPQCTPNVKPIQIGPGLVCHEDPSCGFGCWINEKADMDWRWVELKDLPTPTPSPVVTPTPPPVDPGAILRVGSAIHSCRVTGAGRTRIILNSTPRVPVNSSDTRGVEQPLALQDPVGPNCFQSRSGPDPWSDEVMENNSATPWLCQTSLANSDAGRDYTFVAQARPGTEFTPAPNAGFRRSSEVRVRFHSRGVVECLERWDGDRFVPCPEKSCGM